MKTYKYTLILGDIIIFIGEVKAINEFSAEIKIETEIMLQHPCNTYVMEEVKQDTLEGLK